MIAGSKVPEIKEIKQRLIKLGMMEPHPAVAKSATPSRDPPKEDHPQRPLGISGFTRINKISALLGDEAAEDERLQVQARILEALNRSSRADAVVPTAGAPSAIKAVFLKSDGSDETDKTKLETIAEDPTEYEHGELNLVQKSVHLDLGEASDMTVGEASGSPLVANSPPTTKNPQGRKFHSWLSYFYSGGGKTSGATSPVISVPPSPRSQLRQLEMDLPLVPDEITAMLQRRPLKGILKPTKSPPDLSPLPPPIVKSTFLRQEEVHRLTRFATRGQRLGSLGETGRRRRPRVQWNFEENEYGETWSRGEYERGGVEYIAKSLTPELAMMIKRELNEVKKEMPVHEDSKHYTQFYALR